MIEPITGRYLRLDIAGKPHRLYVEEAGSGIPLVCLHTAGADGRQFHGLMADPWTGPALVERDWLNRRPFFRTEPGL